MVQTIFLVKFLPKSKLEKVTLTEIFLILKKV